MAILILVEYVAICVGFWAFPIAYIWLSGGIRRGGWRRTQAGPLLVTLSLVCAGILTVGLTRLVWPNMPGRLFIAAGSYAALLAVVVWLNSLLWRQQRGRRRQERSEHAVQVQAGRLDDHHLERAHGVDDA